VSLPYYKRCPRDFLDGTIGLSLETKGAYAIVLDLIYMRDGRLPDDARYIAGQLGCSVRKWTAILEELVSAGKLHRSEGIISNSRADYLCEETRKYRDKQAEIATKPRKNNDLAQPEPSQSDTDTEEEPPTPFSLAPLAKLIGLSASGSFDEIAEALWLAQPSPGGKRRSARPDVVEAFGAALKRGAVPGDVLRALRAFYALPASRKDNGQYASGAKVILAKDRWREYLPAAKPQPPPVEIDPAYRAHLERHYHATGEWKPEWGEKPKRAA
jgi:uncharacterized protein YdaU (DUF1376 family)